MAGSSTVANFNLEMGALVRYYEGNDASKDFTDKVYKSATIINDGSDDLTIEPSGNNMGGYTGGANTVKPGEILTIAPRGGADQFAIVNANTSDFRIWLRK